MRGIVTLPGMKLAPPNSISWSGIDPRTVRMWSLYWDAAVEPEQHILGFRHPDLEFLRDVGFFKTIPVVQGDGEAMTILTEARLDVFNFLEKQSPGGWAIASDWQSWDGQQTQDQRSLRVALVNAIPVPDEDVPLQDILRFKERRRDEREALMLQVDKLYLSVLASPDKPLAEHAAMAELATGIANQIKVTQEASFKFRLGDLAADFNLVATGMAIAGSVALGAAWPAILGNGLAAGASVSVGKLFGLVRAKKNDTPYRYATLIREEVFGDF